MSDWDDDKRANAVKLYTDRNPTPENSMEIVKEIAEDLGTSPNGLRMILSKAGVYVKKEGGASSGASEKKAAGSTRVSKEDAQNRLTAAIEAVGGTADSDIVSKLTGKAALYFAEILEARAGE